MTQWRSEKEEFSLEGIGFTFLKRKKEQGIELERKEKQNTHLCFLTCEYKLEALGG